MKPATSYQHSPLAHRMRPRHLNEFKGQQHLIGHGKPLRQLIDRGKLGSIILWGPPGSGKTTLARLIADRSNCRFEQISAVSAGVADLRQAVKTAQPPFSKAQTNLFADNSLKQNKSKQRTILFIDEVHRFNKTQQDAILPYVEDGTISLIGATTENPYFEVIPALRSRCSIYRLQPLQATDIEEILRKALNDPERGLDKQAIDPPALKQIIFQSNGDARFALNALDAGAAAAGGEIISLRVIEEILQQTALLYDKAGDEHYDHASAYQKSLRGSDPDAAVYWLGKMIAGGESPRFIGRRLLVTASEDVGNADPRALTVALSAVEAAEKLGFPEARIPLAQATIYVAAAPKSNSAIVAIDKVLADIQKNGHAYPVPPQLKDTHYNGARQMGYGKDYRYPHSFPGHYIKQDYLPPQLKDKSYFTPSDQGFEKRIKQHLTNLRASEDNKDSS